MNKKYISAATALVAIASLAIAIPALADTTTNPPAQQGAWQGKGMQHGPRQGGAMMRPVVVGTVSAVSGNTLTVSGKQGFASTSPTVTYTVDATNATVKKNNATSTIASIATGDTVAISGTVSGSNVTATMIFDGVMRGPGMNKGQGAGAMPTVQGNGQPIVAGTVSAISGSTLTITNKSNVTYTVDASSAKILEGQNTAATLSNVAVGNSVVVQGTVNGTSVTASTIIDQANPANGSGSTPAHPGFFAGIGSFFSHLFGF